jgi:geranylgeranyl diphosphate synthase type I
MRTASPPSSEAVSALVEPALRIAVGRLDEGTAQVCRYHLGFADAEGAELPAGAGGKQVRPLLALLSARAAGQDERDAVPAAVACQLVHDFSLLHDDVMDGDVERRHRPTTWAVFGVPAAILAGDAMLNLAHEVLSETASPTAGWAARCLGTATRRLIAGQTADLAFESRPDVTLAECLRMAEDKTGALIACSACLGAVLVDAPAALVLGLADFGSHLGLAFQVTDDLLGIWGAPERTGKPARSDIASRKKSVPVVAALQSCTPAGWRLRQLYQSSGPLQEDDLQTAAELVEEAGGRDFAERLAREQSDAALAALSAVEETGAATDVVEELAAITGRLCGRDR